MVTVSGQRVDLLARWTRAGITASVALTVAAVAHTSAGGLLPPVPVLLLLGAVTVTACAVLLRHAASTRRIVALVVSAQLAGHVVLTALAGHGGAQAVSTPSSRPPAPARSPGRRTGTLQDLTTVEPSLGDTAAPALPHWADHWAGHLVEDLSGPHALMALAHLLAAALLGWWLASGEQALWTLVCLTGTTGLAVREHVEAAFRRAVGAGVLLLATCLEATSSRRTGLRLPAYDGPRPALRARVAGVVTRRGPPLLAPAN